MTALPEIRHLLRETPFGPVAVVWLENPEKPKIIRVILSRSRTPADRAVKVLFPDSRPGNSPAISDVARRIQAFLGGADIRFRLDGVGLDLCSDFQRRVLLAEHGIPRGKVSTYNLIAKHLGKPSAARAVGRALATNPFPIVIPCHRAIRSDRTLGGYQGGLAMKRALLEVEGIEFDAGGRVVTPGFHYTGSV
jgi:methylated-DNA-[protein]-cysteine S-methyltransferase